jgi:hypothetical protein
LAIRASFNGIVQTWFVSLLKYIQENLKIPMGYSKSVAILYELNHFSVIYLSSNIAQNAISLLHGQMALEYLNIFY